MNTTVILCLICIAIEVYHVVLHNTIFSKCNPYFSRMRVLRNYRRMYDGYAALKNKDFSKARNGNKAIHHWFEKNRFHFDTIDAAMTMLPNPVEVEKELITSLSSNTILIVVFSTFIEWVYFFLCIVVIFTIPYQLAIWVAGVIFILSIIHAWNEYDRKMRFWWYPPVDAIICICTYIYIIYQLI